MVHNYPIGRVVVNIHSTGDSYVTTTEPMLHDEYLIGEALDRQQESNAALSLLIVAAHACGDEAFRIRELRRDQEGVARVKRFAENLKKKKRKRRKKRVREDTEENGE